METTTQKPTVRIEDWAVQNNPYSAPEQRQQRLSGHVMNHPKVTDSERRAFTSNLVSIDVKAGRAETQNTIYELGKPNAEYKAAFPQHFEDQEA